MCKIAKKKSYSSHTHKALMISISQRTLSEQIATISLLCTRYLSPPSSLQSIFSRLFCCLYVVWIPFFFSLSFLFPFFFFVLFSLIFFSSLILFYFFCSSLSIFFFSFFLSFFILLFYFICFDTITFI